MLIAVLILAAPASQHAALHPKGANLYAEVPDAGAAITTYARAPLVQMITGAGAARIADVSKEFGYDLRATLGSLLPVEDPTRPDDRWWPWSAARTVSFSMHGAEAAPEANSAPMDLAAWMIADFTSPQAAEQARLALLAMAGSTPHALGELVAGDPESAITSIEVSLATFSTTAHVARVGSRVVACAGDTALDGYLARSSTPDSGLSALWDAATTSAAFDATRGVVVMDLMADWEQGPSFLAGESAISSLAVLIAPFLGAQGRWRIELDGDRFRTSASYEPRGIGATLIEALGAKPLAEAGGVDPRTFLPPDAHGTWVTRLDPARFESAAGVLLASALGDAAPKAPTEDEPRLADGLGTGFAASFLPLQSLMSPSPRLLVSVELRDATKFQAGLDAWIARAQAAKPDLVVERRPYRKVPILQIGGGDEARDSGSSFGAGALEPTRIAIVVLPDRVLFASAVTVARAEIKRLQDAKDGEAPVLHAAAHALALPSDAIEASTMDWGGFLAKVYDGARGVLPMMAQNREQPLDLAKLLTGEELFAPFRRTTSLARRVGGRLHVRSESSFGPETPAAIAGLALVVTKAMTPSPIRGASVDSPADVTVPTPPSGPVADPTATTLAALRDVRTAIAVYRSQAGRAPSALADLLQKTDAFPDGFLKGGKVPQDAWGRDLVYAVSDAGANYALRSLGPDGVDQQGAGDDVRLP